MVTGSHGNTEERKKEKQLIFKCLCDARHFVRIYFIVHSSEELSEVVCIILILL